MILKHVTAMSGKRQKVGDGCQSSKTSSDRSIGIGERTYCYRRAAPSAQPPDFLTLSVVGIWGATEQKTGLRVSTRQFRFRTQFSPMQRSREAINHRNGAVGVRHVTSRNIFSLSESRANRYAVKPVFCSVAPQPKIYTLRSATPASSTQFPPFFEEIENMHMAHDVLHQ